MISAGENWQLKVTKNRVYTEPQSLPTSDLVITQGKMTNFTGEKRSDPLNQVLKVNVSTTDTH